MHSFKAFSCTFFNANTQIHQQNQESYGFDWERLTSPVSALAIRQLCVCRLKERGGVIEKACVEIRAGRWSLVA